MYTVLMSRASEHRHRHRQRVIRGVPDELADQVDAAARAAGSDRSTITRALWAWYVGAEGAELPERPANATHSQD